MIPEMLCLFWNLHILYEEAVCDILYDLHMMLVPYLTGTKHVLPA